MANRMAMSAHPARTEDVATGRSRKLSSGEAFASAIAQAFPAVSAPAAG
jgi:hypothetical protein